MTVHVDLEALRARESEQVEWKLAVADPDDVVRTLTAFANDLANLGGGYVVCGAEEGRDAAGFSSVNWVGLSAARLREVEGKVMTACRERVTPPLAPLVEEVPVADSDRRLLIFVMPTTGRAHSERSAEQGTRYYVRLSRETREARNGLLLELLARRGAVPSWDRRPCPLASPADIDLLALRDTLVREGSWTDTTPIDAYLTGDRAISAMVPPLCQAQPLTGTSQPRNFAVLLFGRATQQFLPQAHTILSMYTGTDRTGDLAHRHELTGTVLQQASRAIELLRQQAYMVIDHRDSAGRTNRLRYPERALRELLVNALVHRDYELPHPVRVTVFADRVEVLSPGSLDRAVPADLFASGAAPPVWRNQALAWFFNRLDLAQAEGQGMAVMLKAMRDNGNPPPEFRVTDGAVIGVLRAVVSE